MLYKIIDKILTVTSVLTGFLLLFITFSISYTIFARALGFAGMISVVQFTEYSLLWSTLMGSAWVLKRNKHVTVDLIVGNLRPKVKAYFHLIHSVIGAAVCGVMCWYGTVVTWGQFQRGIIDVQVVDIPKYLVLIIIPIGFLLLTLQFILHFVQGLKGINTGKAEDNEETFRGGVS